MNRSYSKTRHINSTNYLLEQKYLEDKRKTDLGILVESPKDCEDPTFRYRNKKYCESVASDPNFSISNAYNQMFPQKTSLFPSEKELTATFPQEYSCVSSNKSAKRTVRDDGSVEYDINGVRYFGNGRRRDQNGNNSNYHCSADGTIKDGVKPQETTTDGGTTTTGGGTTTTGGGVGYSQVGGGYVFNTIFTPQTLTTIRQKIGNSQDTSATLSQNDINLLYQKISTL